MTEVHRAHIQISRPIGNDPGTIEESHFIVVGGDTIVLTDMEGRPLVRDTIVRRRGDPVLLRWERKLSAGEDIGRCARELLWTRYRATRRGSDFGRRLDMSKWGSIA
jgi:hypothetical protein